MLLFIRPPAAECMLQLLAAALWRQVASAQGKSRGGRSPAAVNRRRGCLHTHRGWYAPQISLSRGPLELQRGGGNEMRDCRRVARSGGVNSGCVGNIMLSETVLSCYGSMRAVHDEHLLMERSLQ
jgi:hypothetical protein